MIERLRIRNFRSLRSVDLAALSRVVAVSGGNGAGKTSILEAIYLLSRGRSFRGRRWGALVTEGERSARIGAGIVGRDGSVSRWELRRTGEITERLVEGNPISEEDKGGLRVRLLGEGAERLLEDEPAVRRRFLDLNLFHVEPAYAGVFSRFQRALRQRNAWIRSGALGEPVWDQEYAAAAEAVTELREGFVRDWSEALSGVSQALGAGRDLGIGLDKGWEEGTDLRALTRRDRETERSLGYTRWGPARADWTIVSEGRRKSLSRGQSKALVCLLQLAARGLEVERTGRRPVWLVDDLRSGLDEGTFGALAESLVHTGDQLFFTFVGAAADRDKYPQGLRDAAWFHVERGALNDCPACPLPAEAQGPGSNSV